MSSNFLGGLPIERWIGRRVLLNNRTRFKGGAKINALLVSVGKRTAVVKPMGHRHDETVPIEDLSPWWSKNPDLAQERRR
jgi:hypothetical protein